jgi:hypothetical protein
MQDKEDAADKLISWGLKCTLKPSARMRNRLNRHDGGRSEMWHAIESEYLANGSSTITESVQSQVEDAKKYFACTSLDVLQPNHDVQVIRIVTRADASDFLFEVKSTLRVVSKAAID